jgi:hypothetical protein
VHALSTQFHRKERQVRGLLKMEHGRLIRLITRFILAVNGVTARVDRLRDEVAAAGLSRPGPTPSRPWDLRRGDSDNPLAAYRAMQAESARDDSWADGGFEFDFGDSEPPPSAPTRNDIRPDSSDIRPDLSDSDSDSDGLGRTRTDSD